jgi:hypothetical protein
LLDGFLGGQPLLTRGRGTADLQQARDLRHLQSRPTMQKEMTESLCEKSLKTL